jgi:hypothetical protein
MPFRGWESSQLHTRVTHANLTPLEILSCLRQVSVLLRILRVAYIHHHLIISASEIAKAVNTP